VAIVRGGGLPFLFGIFEEELVVTVFDGVLGTGTEDL
jgi:hypothetical protein